MIDNVRTVLCMHDDDDEDDDDDEKMEIRRYFEINCDKFLFETL